MSKHTPGPWYAVQYANWFNIQTTEEYSTSNVLDLDCCEEAEANAQLAAAAPKLLEMLKHCREWHKHHVDLICTYGSKQEHMLMHHRDQIASITAAITKAEPAAEPTLTPVRAPSEVIEAGRKLLRKPAAESENKDG